MRLITISSRAGYGFQFPDRRLYPSKDRCYASEVAQIRMSQQPDFALRKCRFIDADTPKARYMICDDTRQQRAAKPGLNGLKNGFGIIDGHG